MLGRRKQFRNGEQKTYLIVCSSLVVYTLKYKRYKNEIDKLKSTTIYHIREGSAQCKCLRYYGILPTVFTKFRLDFAGWGIISS